MERIMTYETLRWYAYVNDKICKQPIRGVVVAFFGFGNQTRYTEDPVEGEFYGDRGILYVYPYNNPWNRMNRQAVDYTDEVLDVLFAHYGLPDSTPIVASGGSMGGQGALTYMVYAKRTPVACVANCPVCDMVGHWNAREDLPRSFYSAVYGYPGSFDAALESLSPLHLADRMPDADYHIFHCTADRIVPKALHSDKLVPALRAAGRRVTYDVVEGRGHCSLTLAAKEKYAAYILAAIPEKA